MKLRVLVVDDYPGAADVSCVLVRLLGHEAVSAKTGREAVDLVTSYQPDVIVLDLGLPDLSGYDVARAVRARDGKQPFIAAMTGLDAATDRAQSLAAGIDLHLVKPTSAESIDRIVAAAIVMLSARAAADRA